MWLFKVFRRLGPSFVYVLTALGAGDLVANAAAGAGYGYALIWTLAFTLLFRFVWVSASAKYVLVTGESLAQGYARVGRWVVWIILISGIIIGHFSAMYSLLMSGTVANMLLPLNITILGFSTLCPDSLCNGLGWLQCGGKLLQSINCGHGGFPDCSCCSFQA